jgi:hypothetical protein
VPNSVDVKLKATLESLFTKGGDEVIVACGAAISINHV